MHIQPLIIGLIVLSLAGCGDLTRVPGIEQYYLDGRIARTFDYTIAYADGDREQGTVAMNAIGSFAADPAYSLAGDLTITVRYDYHDTRRILGLPDAVLAAAFPGVDLTALKTLRPLSAERKRSMGLEGDIQEVNFDTGLARQRGLTTSAGSFSKPKQPFDSRLYGGAPGFADEAVMVWVKWVLAQFNMMGEMLGSWQTTAVVLTPDGDYRVEMTNTTTGLTVTGVLRRSQGLISLQVGAATSTLTLTVAP